jgi:hypothetical protein
MQPSSENKPMSRKSPTQSRRTKLRKLMQSPSPFKPVTPGLDHILAGKAYLPTDPQDRKATPIVTGFLDYFPLACLEVSRVSVAGNNQHNPGQPLHWARGKSGDQADTAVRHIMERGAVDVDGQYHMAKAIWRMMADFQIFLEEKRGLPPSRASWTN